MSKYEIRPRGKQFRVYDTSKKVYITNAVPSKEICQEIIDDFEAMGKKDFRPLGLPDFSKDVN